MLESNPSRNSRLETHPKDERGRRLDRSDRFPQAFKTHQEKPPRSGILVFVERWKKYRSRTLYKRRSAAESTRSMAGFRYFTVFLGSPK
jgi:hypothetical protein